MIQDVLPEIEMINQEKLKEAGFRYKQRIEDLRS
jgi:hypothetical protein